MSKATNTVVLLCGKQDIRIEKQSIPENIGKDDVLLAMQACGICGTDLALWEHGGTGGFEVTEPFGIGHEVSAIVVKVGEKVSNLKAGDKVALELGLPCRNCLICKSGQYNLCKPFSAGGLRNYFVHPADFCHKLPANVSLEEGALCEPLAVGVRACKRAGVFLGASVLICGMGPIGLASILAAKSMGATSICATDISQFRLDLAKRMGATSVLRVEKGLTSREVAKQIVDTMGGGAPDITIECSGVEISLQTSIYATKSGGVVLLVALEPEEATLPIVNAAVREVDIRATFSYVASDYQAAIAMVASGQVKVASEMITHRFKLDQIMEAVNLAKSRQDGIVKIMIDCTT